MRGRNGLRSGDLSRCGFSPLRGTETVVEATYQMQLAGWWVVQPSLQYVVHPGAGIPSATSPARRHLPDAAVFGLRSSIAF